MDKSKFVEACPGKLVRLDFPTRDWAFVPNELPPSWEFDTALWPLVADAKESLGTLNGIGQTLPNPELLLRPLQNREAITSSAIEGTFVTPEQLLLYELDPKEPRDERMADWLEVFNYNRALIRGRDLLNELPFCTRVIKEMHEILMYGVRGRDKHPGQFRKIQVQIGSSGRFVPPPANEIDRLMSNIEKYINSSGDSLDPLVRCFVVHYQFEAIHPFADGNGRVGRVLLALMIYRWLGHAMPWLYMSAFFEQYKDEYADNLFRISSENAWSRWVEYCLRGVISQAKDSVRRCHEFIRLRAEFHNRIDDHSPRTHPLIESLFSSPVLTISSTAKKFQIAYHTARTDVNRLVTSGILSEIPDRHPKSFYAREVMNIAYGSPGESTAVQGDPEEGGSPAT